MERPRPESFELIAHHHRMFAWDDWANREALASLRACGAKAPASAVKRLAHVVAAERLWWARIARDREPVPVWPDWDLDECAERIDDVARRWAERLKGLSHDGLVAAVAYVNSKGESFASTVGDILTHVIAHSAYHRGQIASDVRAAGFAPALTDFIHCVRQGLVR